MQPKQAVLAVFAGILTTGLLFGPFLEGFQRMETDFPNYYTAAKLTAERKPLRQFYDWVWFQREIHFAGIDHQLGGYIPHTPLTMLPFLPLIAFSPQHAKQIWLLLEVILLAASVLLLARISRLPRLDVLVLSLLAYSSLSFNFKLGQYYILILCLLVASFYCLLRRREYLGGALLALIFALKLYTAPFALYFLVRRQWKALAGFGGTVAALSLLALALFGWSDVWFFVTTVMARGLDGSVMDPYNPGLASMTAFLRRAFIPEPELNPQPTWNNPAAFFFLRTAYTLGVLGISLIALRRRHAPDESRALAWFVVVLFVLSPNEASYTFVLLLAPVVLLLDGTRPAWSAIVIALYAAVELPLFPWDAALFPKAWLMLALFIVAGWPFLRKTPAPARWATALAVICISVAAAVANMRVYRIETAQARKPALVEANGIYAGSPTLGADGWIYEAIAYQRYLFREATTTGTRTLKFDGDAFHPSAARQGHMMAFELVANGHSHIELLNQDTKDLRIVAADVPNPREPALSADGTKLAFVAGNSLYLYEGGVYRVIAAGEISNPAFFPDNSEIVFSKGRPGKRSIESISTSGANMRTLIIADGDCFQPAVSPDSHLLAYTCSATGSRHIWIEDMTSKTSRRLTSGNCDNESPAWDGDSQAIVFSSDCSRGLGLSALYRVPISSAGLDLAPPAGKRRR